MACSLGSCADQMRSFCEFKPLCSRPLFTKQPENDSLVCHRPICQRLSDHFSKSALGCTGREENGLSWNPTNLGQKQSVGKDCYKRHKREERGQGVISISFSCYVLCPWPWGSECCWLGQLHAPARLSMTPPTLSPGSQPQRPVFLSLCQEQGTHVGTGVPSGRGQANSREAED